MKFCAKMVAAFLATPLALLGLTAEAVAEEYGSLSYNENVPGVLFLAGKIKDGDSFELRRAMRDHEIDLVVTASPGGNVYEGLQMAAILHDKGVSTYVPEGAECVSSCASVFLGGSSRVAFGELGVHQFYSVADDASARERKDVMAAATQYTTSDIIGILNEFQTPPFVYEKMFGTTDMYYFRGAEKQRISLGADNNDFLERITQIDEYLASNPELLQRRDPAPEWTSAVVSALPQNPEVPPEPNLGNDNVFYNLDFFGMDLSPTGIRDISLSACQNYCVQTPSCAAYSYVHETRWCWPKSGVQNISMANGVTSGIVNYAMLDPSVFDRPYLETTGVDIPGYDLYPKGLRNMSLDQCRHACQATSSCVAFSYVPKKSWCFPKYGAGGYRDQIGIISGVLNVNR